MDVLILRTLFDYNYWANRRLLVLASSLPASDVVAPGVAGTASLLDTLIHILFAEWIWRMRIQEGFSPGRAYPAEVLAIPEPVIDPGSALAELEARWVEEEGKMRAYLSGLNESDLAKIIRYQTMSGQVYGNALWQLLFHLLNHGTQHRSEVALRLTELGDSPGDLDFIVYLRENVVR